MTFKQRYAHKHLNRKENSGREKQAYYFCRSMGIPGIKDFSIFKRRENKRSDPFGSLL